MFVLNLLEDSSHCIEFYFPYIHQSEGRVLNIYRRKPPVVLLLVVTHLLALPEATPSRGADLHRAQPALSHWLVFVAGLE